MKKIIAGFILILGLAGCAGQAFEKARLIDTPESYDTLLKNNTGSEFEDKAHKLRAKALIKQIKQKNTIAAYENYLKNNPDELYIEEINNAKLKLINRIIKNMYSGLTIQSRPSSLSEAHSEEKHTGERYVLFGKV
ncbi:MAG TPA: hypothetical protein EYG40_12370 [Verrucomicrobia bacterium]|jgi:hypothetical protein|nr:hypothetical protein [Nitrospinales bacterium]HIL55815.1 hypothetical protein [Verrucomicrobiota bacterium]|tara:strand:+ start:141 stop:548 length:408 start_codon:yes stop_codon:yes gene_type:complete